MKDHLRELVDRGRTTSDATLLVREYLQARVLEALQQAGAFQNWAFLGGTALRFLYRLPRFSEDLDFSRVTIGAPRDVLLRSTRILHLRRVRRHRSFAATCC